MRRTSMLVAATLALSAPVPVAGQSFSGAERIAQGDLTGAEREIAAQRRLFPNDPDLLMNLAAVYARTSRTADARALYRVVLAQPDEELTLIDGAFASSHRLADAGLRRLNLRAVATR